MAESYRIVVQALDSDKMVEKEDIVDYSRRDLLELANNLGDSYGSTDCAMLHSAIWYILDGT